MKSLLLLCSFLLLGYSPFEQQEVDYVDTIEATSTNPYLKLAEMNMSVDDYVNTIVERTDITADQILHKAKEPDSWFYKAFIRDSKYMDRMYKMHIKLKNQFDETTLESASNFKELEEKFPHYSAVLPILSSPGAELE
jgi:hypothetical protein